MKVSRYIAETLDKYGVTAVFFVPTILSHTLAEMEKSTSIRRIMTHGEKAAVYMADGYARVTGRPGICMAQEIGASNLAAGLRDPYMACTPLLAFTGGGLPRNSGRHVYQEIEDLPMFKPVTKSSEHLGNAEDLPGKLDQAFRTAVSGKPGPVHLEIEGHFGELEQKELEPVEADPSFSKTPCTRQKADPEKVKKAAEYLARSKQPVIIAGGGTRYSGAGEILCEFAQATSIPVALSMNAKALMPADHSLNIGVPGLYSRKSANRAVLEADLVFFIGSQTSSHVTSKWQVPPEGTPVIQLDIDPEELGRHYKNEVSLEGDARTVLKQLLEICDKESAEQRTSWAKQVQDYAKEWRRECAKDTGSEKTPIHPARICNDLGGFLPDGTIVVTDTGHAGMWTAAYLDLKQKNPGFIRTAGSLGWGLPAAIGAKAGCPDRPVLLFTGDGGFWYHVAELETAVRYNIPVVILINNNNSMNQEVPIYRDAYGGTLKGKHGELWQFTDVDFTALAETMGAKGVRVDYPSEFSSALQQAFEADTPFVLDVRTDPEAMAPLAFLGEGRVMHLADREK